MSNIAGSSLYSSTNTSTSTLRPRNNRLISYLDDTASDSDTPSQAISTSHSTSASRGASPAAGQTHPRLVTHATDRSPKKPHDRNTFENAERRSSSGLWESWSSIQGVASSFFGGEGSGSGARRGSGAHKTPLWMKQDSRFKTAPTTSQWGPGIQTNVATAQPGSIEDRQALVQAKKREALLLSSTLETRDENGRFKRKGSSADIRVRSPTLDLGEDALVYRHKVQPHDTLAGVMIKYSCQQEVFRKVNRFWPNDNIQTRTQVFLPVNACGVRGRRVDDLTSAELLSRDLSPGHDQDASQKSAPTIPSKAPAVEESEYRHDCYVLLPSFSEPVEILRIPRRTLGYFPPARRKSNHALDSMSSTPRTSFDTLRHPPSHAAQQAAAAQQTSISLSTSPARRPRLSSATRQRSSSTAATTTTNSSGAWILRGPGGVGTLRGLRTDVSRPGPAEDPLNQKFAKYLPDVAPPPQIEDIGSLLASRVAVSRTPYRSGPRLSTDSTRSSRSNSSTFGAGVTGVENFMRKLAVGGKRPDIQRSNSGNPANTMGLPVGGETGLGDLIELETNTDTMHHFDEHRHGNTLDDGDGETTPTATMIGRSDEELLNERFPIRGRITRAYGGDES